MGVFKKLKDIFYDEEIIEEEEIVEKPVIKKVEKEPIKRQEEPKRESERVEVPKSESLDIHKFEEPKVKPIEEKKEVTERDLYQNKQTFKFPILDDEEDFEPTRVKKTRSGSANIMDIERRNREVKKQEEPKTEPVKKAFKPSPVISPIYGIMDKDYDKTELMNKSKENVNTNRTSLDYDIVRKKAYGSLDEEVKKKEKPDASKVLESVTELEQELENVQRKSNIESLLESIEENSTLTVGDLEQANEVENITQEISRLDKYKEKTAIENEKEIGDKTLEHDLFNLIDSMYEEENKE